MQVFFPGGDGWLYGFNALTGQKLWKFDLNPKDAVWPKTRNDAIAAPVFHGGRVYVATGHDPEHGEGVGHLYSIDPRGKSGDITELRARLALHQDPPIPLHRRDRGRAGSSSRISAAFCTAWTSRPESPTGRSMRLPPCGDRPWSRTGRSTWGTRTATSIVLQAGKEMKKIAEMNMGTSVYSTPVPANGVLFIMTRNTLYALLRAKTTGLTGFTGFRHSCFLLNPVNPVNPVKTGL